jgi:class 3 adenylate cyclase/tetratricopeptide (TPR) repeat protein
MACGAALQGADGGKPQATTKGRGEERRTVTVMFADIVGYTTIAERLDHESVKRITDRCMERLAVEVERFGGYVDQYIGDNLMAVFGAPQAHENDAERAVRAACAMHDAMTELNGSLGADYGVELSLRVGVNTGEVLAGTVGGEYTVVGDAVNIASRLQGAGERGRTLVGERTRRSTAATVSYRPVGSLALKGKEQPVSAWEVTAIEAPGAGAGLAVRAPLIGRRSELEQLSAVYDQAARQGDAQIVTLIGEAGVGKTRLVQELQRFLAKRRPAPLLLRGRALGFGAESGFGPLAQMLRERSAAGDGGEAARSCERLLDALSPGDGSEPELDGEDARERFFATVVAFVRALAADRLPVLVWEDAQWADEGTLELIDHLADSLNAPVLQVCVGREELLARRPRWATNRRRRTCVFLEPLEPGHARELIDALLPGDASERQRELLAERTGGNPLFAEALVDALGEGEGPGPALPETIQGLLATRLDALGPFERQLLGHASVVGLRFPLDALQSLSAGADLHAAIGTLQERNLIVAGADREYAFAHMLIREAAYEMLPKAVRARKHVEVAQALARNPGAIGEPSAFALAVHYERAATLAAEIRLPSAELVGMRRAALEHGIAAGDAAAALFSNQEALERYHAASAFAEAEDPLVYEIAERSGDVESRLGRMDAAIDAWGLCLSWHRGREDAERSAEMHRKIAAALVHKGERDAAIKHLQRGINMVRDEPASAALARLFGEAAALYMQLGANMLAAYAAERALAIAEQLDDPRAASRAHMIYGGVYARIGDAEKARHSLLRAVELVRDVDPSDTVVALLAAGRLDRFEGDQAGARQRFREGLALARRTGDVPMQIELHAALGAIALLRAEWRAAAEEADAAAGLAEAHGLAGKLCLAEVLRGRLRWQRGDLDDSARLFASAREGAAQLGFSEVRVEAMLGLGATLCDASRPDAAAAAFGEAAAACERAGLGPQATEAEAGLARVARRAGKPEDAAEATARAQRTAAHGPDPVTAAAALEAAGWAHGEAARGAAELDLAQQRWEELGRPLDAARCVAGVAERLRGEDPERARSAARQAAGRFEQLEVAHLAERSRQLAQGSAGAVN